MFEIKSQIKVQAEDGSVKVYGPGEHCPELPGELRSKFLTSGQIVEIDTDGNVIPSNDTDDAGGEVLGEDYLRGLISPGRIEQASKLLESHSLSRDSLFVLKKKCEEVFNTGINKPALKYVYELVKNQLTDVINENAEK